MHPAHTAKRAHTYVALLKSCAEKKDLARGIQLQDDLVRWGVFKGDPFVGSAMVDMFMKCGAPARARKTFDEFPQQNPVLWNALIAGYIANGDCEEALDCYYQMLCDGVVFPTAITFVCILRALANLRYIEQGLEMHAEIERRGLLESNGFVGSTLVDMYAKFGLLATASEVFEKLPVRDVVTWTALISGWAERGPCEEALKYFEQMSLEGVSPNPATYICTLKACANITAVHSGRDIHVELERRRLLDKGAIVGSTLVHMYAKCGVLAQAQQVFDNLSARNVVTWTSLLAGYVEHGHGEEALKCFEQMQRHNITPNSATYVCALKACAITGAVDKGQDLHTLLERRGFLENNLFIGSSLVDMYAKWGLLANAQQVFDKFCVHDIVLWNTMITVYVRHGQPGDALKCYEKMQLENVTPNAVTFIGSLKACGSLRDSDKGQDIHDEIEKRKGLLERDVVLASTLVDMYIKCGMLLKARQVFDKLPVIDTILWTTLISGYVESGHGEDALECFEKMQRQGISPDAVTLICSLKACGNIKAVNKGLEIHAEIERKGLLEKDVMVGSTLVDMYAKCGLLVRAQHVFDKLPARDVVAWTALISGYAEHEQAEESLDYLDQMRLQGVSPNAVTITSGLRACGNLGATEKGLALHAEIQRRGLLEQDLVVGSTLVDMYAKCGFLLVAQQVFDKLPRQDVVAWNVLISGYSQLGTRDFLFCVFERMLKEGVKPDPVTFLVVLHGCSRVGLFNQSQSYFEALSRDHGIVPAIEHHNVMVDLLSRAGQLEKALTMIERAPFCPTLIMWRAVLAACLKWGNRGLARHAFQHAIGMDSKNSAAYVLMSHICAAENEDPEAFGRARMEDSSCDRFQEDDRQYSEAQA